MCYFFYNVHTKERELFTSSVPNNTLNGNKSLLFYRNNQPYRFVYHDWNGLNFLLIGNTSDTFQVQDSFLNYNDYISYVQIFEDIMCYSFKQSSPPLDFYVNCINITSATIIRTKKLTSLIEVKIHEMIFFNNSILVNIVTQEDSSGSTQLGMSMLSFNYDSNELTVLGNSEISNLGASFPQIIDCISMIEINHQVVFAYHIQGLKRIMFVFISIDDNTYNLTQSSQLVTVGIDSISVFQVAILSNELNIIGYNSEGYYKVILFSMQNNTFIFSIFSEPIKIIEWMESGEFVTLSNYNIYLIRSGFADTPNPDTLYIGNIVSFSLGAKKGNYINEDFFFNFYIDNMTISRCDSSCKLCSSFTECISCYSGYLLFGTKCINQRNVGYITLSNGNCQLTNNTNALTLPKEEMLSAVQVNLNVINSSYILRGNNYTIEVSRSDSKRENNITGVSFINFKACENILYKELSLNPIFIIKVDDFNEKSLIPNVTYTVYDTHKNIIDTSLCRDIMLSYPLLNTSSINYDKAKKMKEEVGVDIFNIDDDFYKDKCFPYKENSDDIVLTDRVNDIYPNVTFCENGCYYQGVDYTSNRVTCRCQSENNHSEDANNKTSFLIDLYDLTNLDLFKCGKNLIDGKIKKNIGLYFGACTLLAQFVLIFYFILSNEVNTIYLSIFSYKSDLSYIKSLNSSSSTSNENDDSINLDICEYKKAIQHENRTPIHFFIFLFLNKLDLISLIFFREQYQLVSVSLTNYFFALFFDFTMNAVVFSDDVITEKYHNKGSISIWTTFTLTIASNFLSYIVAAMVKRLTNYSTVLELMMENMNRNNHFYMKGKKVFEFIKIKLYLFYGVIIGIVLISFYYIDVFCAVYSGSQWSWFSNSLISIGISLLTSLGLCILISLFRYIGLKLGSENIYNISLYLNK